MKKHLIRSRRTFLKQTLLAGAAPLILPRGLRAAGSSPNERITLGFIGMGKQGHGLLGGFLGRKETQVLAVCDVDTTRREQARQRVNAHYANRTASDASKACSAYNEFEDLLDRECPGAVDHVRDARVRRDEAILGERELAHVRLAVALRVRIGALIRDDAAPPAAYP